MNKCFQNSVFALLSWNCFHFTIMKHITENSNTKRKWKPKGKAKGRPTLCSVYLNNRKCSNGIYCPALITRSEVLFWNKWSRIMSRNEYLQVPLLWLASETLKQKRESRSSFEIKWRCVPVQHIQLTFNTAEAKWQHFGKHTFLNIENKQIKRLLDNKRIIHLSMNVS